MLGWSTLTIPHCALSVPAFSFEHAQFLQSFVRSQQHSGSRPEREGVWWAAATICQGR